MVGTLCLACFVIVLEECMRLFWKSSYAKLLSANLDNRPFPAEQFCPDECFAKLKSGQSGLSTAQAAQLRALFEALAVSPPASSKSVDQQGLPCKLTLQVSAFGIAGPELG